MLVELIQQHFGVCIPAHFDHDPHAVAIAFVPQIGQPFNDFVSDQIGDGLDQPGFIHLVRNFRHQDPLFAIAHSFDAGVGPHTDSAAAGRVGGTDPVAAHD